eukprot:g15964.t1
MPQHVHIEGETEEQILHCERLVEPLLNPESPEFEYARTHGMQQLAMVNGEPDCLELSFVSFVAAILPGFSLNKAEQRCGICGALGHLGFECPETNNQNYKMANVTCTICGDKGHVASDCKKAAEINKRENVDWKAMAEKKAQMDKEILGDCCGNVQAGGQPSGGQTLVTMDSAPGAGTSNAWILSTAHPECPAGATIKKMAADTGAQINMDSVVQPGGGKAVVITAADPAARERAKVQKACASLCPKSAATRPMCRTGSKTTRLRPWDLATSLAWVACSQLVDLVAKVAAKDWVWEVWAWDLRLEVWVWVPVWAWVRDLGWVEWVRAWAKAAWDLCLAQARLEQLRTARYADRSPGGMGKGMGPPGAPPMGMGLGGKGMGGCGMGMQNMPKSTGGLMPQNTGD